MSLDAQETELRAIAAREGIEIVKVFRESMSAKAPGRPLFAEMLGLITKGKADMILCWKIDRLARNPVDGGSIHWMLQSGQIQSIRTYDRTHLPSDNVLLMYVELGMSNQYSRELSAVVKRGNREKVRRGEWPNRAPFGYANSRNPKTIKPKPDEARKVKEIYSKYVSGEYSMKDLGQEYGKSRSQIELILSRTVYYGMTAYHGELYPGIHQPLITKELYDQAQEMRLSKKTAHQPRPQTLFFPYRGFMNCAECGCLLTATRKKGKYDYYYCTNGKGGCNQHQSYIRAKDADSFFVEALQAIQFDNELIEIMYQAAREKHQNGQYDIQKTLDEIDYQIHQIELRERRLLNSYTSGHISESLYSEEAGQIQKQKKQVQRRRENYQRNSENGLGTLELTKRFFQSSNAKLSQYLAAEPEQKQQIAKTVLWNFEVKDKKALRYKYHSPFDVLANAPKNGDLAVMLPD